MKRYNLRATVFMGVFIALEVVLTRFLSIQTPIVRIGFTFLPVAVSAMMFGPVYSGIAAALADILGMILFSSGGAYFPGFTVTAFLGGVIYGLLLYKKPKSFWRISLAVVIISIFVNLGIDSVWIWMITGKGLMAILPARVIKCIIIIPLQVIMIQLVWKYLVSNLDRSLSPKGAKT